MTITLCSHDTDAARVAAERVALEVHTRPALVLGLPTGRTSVPFYRHLALIRATDPCRFERVATFNLDEFVGLGPAHPGSYRAFMDERCFRPLGIGMSRVHFLDGLAADLQAECERYEDEVERAGGTDIQVLGLGTNGHIGFNEPSDALRARTHRVTLRPETRQANAWLFGGDLRQVPREALSMGMGTILRARAIILIATSTAKREAVTALVEGPITPRVPASFLQLHADVEVILDERAAAGLGQRSLHASRRVPVEPPT